MAGKGRETETIHKVRSREMSLILALKSHSSRVPVELSDFRYDLT